MRYGFYSSDGQAYYVDEEDRKGIENLLQLGYFDIYATSIDSEQESFHFLHLTDKGKEVFSSFAALDQINT